MHCPGWKIQAMFEKYTRNFFRLNIFPAVKEVYSNAEDNILNSVQLFQEAEILFNQAIEVHKKNCWKKGNEIHIPVLKLKQSEPLQKTIIWEIIRYFGFTPGQTAEVIKLMNADNGSYIGSASHRIIKTGPGLLSHLTKRWQLQPFLLKEMNR